MEQLWLGLESGPTDFIYKEKSSPEREQIKKVTEAHVFFNFNQFCVKFLKQIIAEQKTIEAGTRTLDSGVSQIVASYIDRIPSGDPRYPRFEKLIKYFQAFY